MDVDKCQALKDELFDEAEAPLVPIERYFDGNDDEASIGCNLMPHPGMVMFKGTLTGLLGMKGIDGVWALISEIDPDDDCWPFTDTVVVAGSMPTQELEKLVKMLRPDTVSRATEDLRSAKIPATAPLHIIWWD